MSEPQSLSRPRFVSGRLLKAEDFALQQNYFREKLKRHNRSLHGFGVICGLKVSLDSRNILVEAGMALDCEGNELVVGRTLMLPTPAQSWQTAYVNIRYVEDFVDRGTISETREASRIKEGYEIVLDPENCNRSHRHLRARWLACGKPHAVTIAKLRNSAHGWRVDRRYRPVAVK